MQVQSTTNSGSSTSTTSTSKSSGTDKEAFLKMLVAQLKYQDPLNPTDTTQFMQQMTQYTILEQLQNTGADMQTLLSTQQSAQAASLVGKTVYATCDDASEGSVTGKVESFSISSKDGITLKIGDYTVGLSDVLKVSDNRLGEQLAQANSFLNKDIEATVGTSKTSVSGTVDSVDVVDDEVVLKVGGTSVKMSEVTSVSGGDE